MAEKQAEQAQFAVQRIYIKDISFESPNAPTVFKNKWEPKVTMDINTKNNHIGGDVYEVVLSITLTVSNQEESAYLVEIHQAGIFTIKGVEGDRLKQAMGAFCPNILFPYAREQIDNLLIKGSFPPLMLAPVNFDALYAQSLQKRKEDAETDATH